MTNSFIINMTSVRITSYSDFSPTAERATLIPTDASLTPSPKTAFHLVNTTDLGLEQKLTTEMSETEKLWLTMGSNTIVVDRTEFKIDNVNIQQDGTGDNQKDILFLFPVQLQDK
jgi:hypothetical protein